MSKKLDAVVVEVKETMRRETVAFLELLGPFEGGLTIYDIARSLSESAYGLTTNAPVIKGILGPKRPKDLDLCQSALAVHLFNEVQKIISKAECITEKFGVVGTLVLVTKLSEWIAKKLVENVMITGSIAIYLEDPGEF